VSNGPNYVIARMESAKLVPIPLVAPRRVTFGSRVTITTSEGEEITYTLVGQDEADAERGLISWISSIGKALLVSREEDFVASPSGSCGAKDHHNRAVCLRTQFLNPSSESTITRCTRMYSSLSKCSAMRLIAESLANESACSFADCASERKARRADATGP
jgi:hypothetical protein